MNTIKKCFFKYNKRLGRYCCNNIKDSVDTIVNYGNFAVLIHMAFMAKTYSITYFKNLDGLRTVAFLSVFFYHSFHTEYEYIKNDRIYQFINSLFQNGDLGVNFFFVLSGFLITYLLIKEESVNGKINLKKFYMRRAFRIWPLYFACVLFGFIIFPLFKQFFGSTPNETADPILFLFFLSNFNNIYNGLPDASILGVLWSISIEEQFYLFWPVLLLLFRTNRIYVFISILVITIVFRLVYHDLSDFLYFHSISAFSDLSMGAILAWLAIFKPLSIRKIQKTPKSTIVIAYIIGFILIVNRGAIFQGTVLIGLEKLILSSFFLFIILDQAFLENSFYQMKSSKLLTKLGKYTYGLYCLHFFGILITTNTSKLLGLNTTIWAVLLGETIVALLISTIIAVMSYHLFEKRFLKIKEKRYSLVNGN